MQKKLIWILFAVLSISIGLYPVMYLFMDQSVGLLSSKSPELLSNVLWKLGFYSHITGGGIALLTGWIQFSPKIRTSYLNLHRQMGKIYVIAVLVGGVAGTGVGFFATGGWIAALGFISLGIVWLATTIRAYTAIRQGQLILHQKMMHYSYAACFAAVTLRIWLPLLQIGFGSFIPAYQLVAWICWVPNLLVAWFLVRKLHVQPA